MTQNELLDFLAASRRQSPDLPVRFMCETSADAEYAELQQQIGSVEITEWWERDGAIDIGIDAQKSAASAGIYETLPLVILVTMELA